MNTQETFKSMLDDVVKETGVQLKEAPAQLALYMAERASHLATLTLEPGFDQAVIAERNSVALRAGLTAHDQAVALDWRIIGIIQGALRVAAVALA